MNEELNDEFNKINELEYNFNINERFVHVKDEKGNYFECKTPFLKILKPVHITLNKKKTIAKKYLILETNDELDFNNQIGEFMFIINKIHEISQEKIRLNSMLWFNTEFDEIGLDIKVRKPIDQQKDSEFIKITIPKNLENEVNELTKGNYILCDILFKGLKISSEHIMEEWELKSFITQENYDILQNEDFICNSIVEVCDTLLENDINEIIEENIELVVPNNSVETEPSIDQKTDDNADLMIIKKMKKNIIKEKKKKISNDLIKKTSKKLIFT